MLPKANNDISRAYFLAQKAKDGNLVGFQSDFSSLQTPKVKNH